MKTNTKLRRLRASSQNGQSLTGHINYDHFVRVDFGILKIIIDLIYVHIKRVREHVINVKL